MLCFDNNYQNFTESLQPHEPKNTYCQLCPPMITATVLVMSCNPLAFFIEPNLFLSCQKSILFSTPLFYFYRNWDFLRASTSIIEALIPLLPGMTLIQFGLIVLDSYTINCDGVRVVFFLSLNYPNI